MQTFAPAACNQVLLPGPLGCFKSGFIDYSRVVTGNGAASRNTFFASAHVGLGLVFSEGSSITQHGIDCRMIPFERGSKGWDVLFVEVFGYRVTTDPAYA